MQRDRKGTKDHSSFWAILLSNKKLNSSQENSMMSIKRSNQFSAFCRVLSNTNGQPVNGFFGHGAPAAIKISDL